jgi:hypothetical protein
VDGAQYIRYTPAPEKHYLGSKTLAFATCWNFYSDDFASTECFGNSLPSAYTQQKACLGEPVEKQLTKVVKPL